MIRRPTIFVSHKTGEGPHAALRELLMKRLEEHKKKLEVVFDGWAPGGSRFWEDKDKSLARCMSGIFLVDAEALRSQWVINEITIMCHRAALNQRVRIVPVLAPDLKREDLDKYPGIPASAFDRV